MTFGIDFRDLRYFETIAELEHIGRASERLNRTQPALSSCLRRLENIFGSPLFERAGRGIRLTEAGKILLKWARRVHLDVDDAKREFDIFGRGLSGHIRIGLVPTAAQFLLPKAARQLIDEAPNVSLRTVVGMIDSLSPLLRTGDIDLMVSTDHPDEEGFVSRLVAEDVIVVTANANHPIFRNKTKLGDLTAYRWALQPPGAPTRDWLDSVFDKHHLGRPNVQIESTMLSALPTLIAGTGLLSFISRQHLGNSGGQLKEVPIHEVNMTRRMVLTYRENMFLSPACQRLIDLLMNQDADYRQHRLSQKAGTQRI
jgi:DNA-binding transcriptional LysR family regulator